MASAFGSAGILVTLSFGLFTRFGGVWAALATIAIGVGSFVAASLLGAGTPFLISLAASVSMYVVAGTFERLTTSATS
jgi:hypothetical protein